mmetsp:Transcript_28216/g.58827  ORF Transcript_28216/g.58827 Transcript_28216/m.58827 type:complete len:224 (-) Transcript_28216:2073-2744(-)
MAQESQREAEGETHGQVDEGQAGECAEVVSHRWERCCCCCARKRRSTRRRSSSSNGQRHRPNRQSNAGTPLEFREKPSFLPLQRGRRRQHSQQSSHGNSSRQCLLPSSLPRLLFRWKQWQQNSHGLQHQLIIQINQIHRMALRSPRCVRLHPFLVFVFLFRCRCQEKRQCLRDQRTERRQFGIATPKNVFDIGTSTERENFLIEGHRGDVAPRGISGGEMGGD